MGLTTSATLTQEMMDLIAAELLVSPDDVYLFYQNGPIQRSDADAQVPGVNAVLFNRPTLPTGGLYTESSRRLTDGTAVDLTAIAVAMTQVTLTTREYAGPHDGTAVRPFGLTEFLKKRAKHNIVAIIGEFLRRDRNRWLDTVVMNLLLAASTVQTPDGSSTAAIAAGQSASVAWLRKWNKTMKDAKIPTFANGRWRCIINTTQEEQLKSDEEYREAYRYFAQSNPLFAGHVMTIENFDLMVSTMYSTTPVGAGDSVTGYQATAFGPLGLGHGVTMDPTVRAADDTDFGRAERVIWLSHEQVGTLYSDMITRGITT